MDKSGDDAAVKGKGGALRALIDGADGERLIGCPQWCSYVAGRHQHVAQGATELVLSVPEVEGGEEEVLEVRHVAAPRVKHRLLSQRVE